MTLAIRLPPNPPAIPRVWAGEFSEADRQLLLSPARIGSIELRCRVVQPAMETNLGTKEGRVTERLIDYYGARADGGVGLLIVENTSVHSTGRVTSGMLRIETDEDGAAFAPLAERVQAAGAKLFVQLSHAGRQTLSDFVGGPPWAPSPIPCPIMKDTPREMTGDDVHELIDAFVAGARRAQAAGADGVELHAAHGYLLCGFLSPYSNQRDDAWGGDTARRCAFPAAVVRGIKEVCGAEFPVSVRMSADEYVQGGIDEDEAVRIAERMVEAGADVLHVSACNYESMFWNIPTYFLPEAPFVSLAARVRRAVSVPVISVGRLHRPEVAARVLRSGAADFVSIGRGLIADPNLLKGLDGAGATARPCLACNRCIASINGARLECTVNPDVGFESARVGALRGVPSGARILVVGGGPAGMEAAVRAAQAGHPVTLVDRRPVLGGQLDLAAMPPGKEPVQWYLDWLVRQVGEVDIDVVLGRDAEAADLSGVAGLIWAAGSSPTPRAVPGAEDVPHIPLDVAMRTPALAGARPLVFGGGAGGAECAHQLAHDGAHVVLVELKRKIARDLMPSLRYHLAEELEHEGVRSFVQVRSLSFDGDTAHLEGRKLDERIPGITSVVLAAGRTAAPVPAALSEALDGPVFVVGDAQRPASIFEAVTESAELFRG
ncbi:MAG: FAD-dependent oxidoreductase [Deltaproteobacteria bacterium]|nr:FAD-dependent oxidoreductase [Deltaproteobacteria bacterium]